MTDMEDSAALIELILNDMPRLRKAHRLHLADHQELLPHVFMSDIVTFVLVEVKKDEAQAALIRLLGRLDEGLRRGSQEIKDLVVVSFVENLLGETEGLRNLWPLMGPALKKEVESCCGTAWLDQADSEGAP